MCSSWVLTKLVSLCGVALKQLHGIFDMCLHKSFSVASHNPTQQPHDRSGFSVEVDCYVLELFVPGRLAVLERWLPYIVYAAVLDRFHCIRLSAMVCTVLNNECPPKQLA